VNVGLQHEIDVLPPEWPSAFCTFHTPEWWRRHWTITRCVAVEIADQLPEGCELWMRWHQALGVTDDTFLTSKD
jgi:pyrroloquinoline quinone (PQQ) biosynthesis protein C